MLAYVCLPGALQHCDATKWCAAVVLDDGLLDVAYIMNYPREQVPGLLRELMRGREEGDELEVMDCFGSMRVKWLEVHCADGLQVGHTFSTLQLRHRLLMYMQDFGIVAVQSGWLMKHLRTLVIKVLYSICT